ncbi:MAG: quinone-dependent dihydroorotate dehydrogenase [Bacteroidota bacterium]
MYKVLIRPVLFLLKPEAIHHLLLSFLRIAFRIPGVKYLVSRIYSLENPLLETEFAGIRFRNPVGLAAGFDKNATAFRDFMAFGFGSIEIGTVTPLGQPGNSRPRSFRLPADRALINRMGFNNEGLAAAVEHLSGKRPKTLVIGGNIGKNTLTLNEHAPDDYLANFKALYDVVDYFVVNVSCPNVSDLRKLADQEALEQILSVIVAERALHAIRKPVLLKISPDLNFNQIDETLEIVEKLGIDGIVATNTTVSRSGLKTDPERVGKIGNGGLSGAPLTRRSLEIVRYISSKTGGKLPIIGVGGIMSAGDALKMTEAGASLVQVYTGFIYEGPGIVRKINKAILQQRMGK